MSIKSSAQRKNSTRFSDRYSPVSNNQFRATSSSSINCTTPTKISLDECVKYNYNIEYIYPHQEIFDARRVKINHFKLLKFCPMKLETTVVFLDLGVTNKYKKKVIIFEELYSSLNGIKIEKSGRICRTLIEEKLYCDDYCLYSPIVFTIDFNLTQPFIRNGTNHLQNVILFNPDLEEKDFSSIDLDRDPRTDALNEIENFYKRRAYCSKENLKNEIPTSQYSPRRFDLSNNNIEEENIENIFVPVHERIQSMARNSLERSSEFINSRKPSFGMEDDLQENVFTLNRNNNNYRKITHDYSQDKDHRYLGNDQLQRINPYDRSLTRQYQYQQNITHYNKPIDFLTSKRIENQRTNFEKSNLEKRNGENWILKKDQKMSQFMNEELLNPNENRRGNFINENYQINEPIYSEPYDHLNWPRNQLENNNNNMKQIRSLNKKIGILDQEEHTAKNNKIKDRPKLKLKIGENLFDEKKYYDQNRQYDDKTPSEFIFAPKEDLSLGKGKYNYIENEEPIFATLEEVKNNYKGMEHTKNHETKIIEPNHMNYNRNKNINETFPSDLYVKNTGSAPRENIPIYSYVEDKKVFSSGNTWKKDLKPEFTYTQFENNQESSEKGLAYLDRFGRPTDIEPIYASIDRTKKKIKKEENKNYSQAGEDREKIKNQGSIKTSNANANSHPKTGEECINVKKNIEKKEENIQLREKSMPVKHNDEKRNGMVISNNKDISIYSLNLDLKNVKPKIKNLGVKKTGFSRFKSRLRNLFN